MQQTETYKLNLIETSDTFSPNPLNENAEKLEAVLTQASEADAALDQRVTVLETDKVHLVAGYFSGKTVPCLIELPFKPQAVYIQGTDTANHAKFLAVPGSGMTYSNVPALSLQENGFLISHSSLGSGRWHFIALG